MAASIARATPVGASAETIYAALTGTPQPLVAGVTAQ